MRIASARKFPAEACALCDRVHSFPHDGAERLLPLLLGGKQIKAGKKSVLLVLHVQFLSSFDYITKCLDNFVHFFLLTAFILLLLLYPCRWHDLRLLRTTGVIIVPVEILRVKHLIEELVVHNIFLSFAFEIMIDVFLGDGQDRVKLYVKRACNWI